MSQTELKEKATNEMDNDQAGSQQKINDKQIALGEVNTGGGVYAAGDVATGGGDFTGRDKTVQGDEVRGAKTVGGGELSAVIYSKITNIYNAPGSPSSRPTNPTNYKASSSESLPPRKKFENPRPDESTYASDRRTELLEEVKKTIRIHIQALNDYNQRSMWLLNIPGVNERNQTNGIQDLDLMVVQLDRIGKVTMGRWAMSMFIDNVCRGFEGIEFATLLQGLKRELVHEYDKGKFGTGVSTIGGNPAAREDKYDSSGFAAKNAKTSLNDSEDTKRNPDTAALAKLKRQFKQATELDQAKKEVEQFKKTVGQLKQVIEDTKNEVVGVDTLVKKYEELNRSIEPYLKSVNLMEYYVELYIEYSSSNKRLPTNDVRTLIQQGNKVTQVLKEHAFSNWATGMVINDQVTRVEHYSKLYENFKTNADSLAKLTVNCDPQILKTNLDALIRSLGELLAVWTNAQTTLHNQICTHLDQLRDKLTQQLGNTKNDAT